MLMYGLLIDTLEYNPVGIVKLDVALDFKFWLIDSSVFRMDQVQRHSS